MWASFDVVVLRQKRIKKYKNSFLHHCGEIGSEAYPPSKPIGTGGSLPGGKVAVALS
jgi:hypothetical protein